MIIREMTIDDYDEVYEMWQITTKRALSKADERDQMERYLKHNAGMSQVAWLTEKLSELCLQVMTQTGIYPPYGCSARIQTKENRSRSCTDRYPKNP